MTHSSDPGINKRKASGLQNFLGFMQRLTKPHPAIPEADQRHSQLLSMMLLAFIPLQFIAMLAYAFDLKRSWVPFADPHLIIGWTVLFLFLLEYGLSRTRFYLTVALAFVISVEFEIYFSAIALPEISILLAFLLLGVVLSAELLSWKATTLMFAVVLASTFFLPTLAPSFSQITIISTQLFFISASVIIIAIAVYSQRDLRKIRLQSQSLRESEERLRSLFEDSPTSLWEEDFSAVKQKLESLRALGVTDFYTYLSSHPEIVFECIAGIKVLDVNKAALDLYQAENKKALQTSLTNIVVDPSDKQFLDEFVNIASGGTKFSKEGVDWTLAGKKINVVISWSAAPGHESDLSKVIVSIVDITERKQIEQALYESERRYRRLFEDSPISLWEEDYSAVKQKLESLRAQGVTDFYTYLDSHPEIVAECIAGIKVLDVNNATLNLYKAKSKEILLTNLANFLHDESHEQFLQELVNIATGRANFSMEGVNWTVTGDRIDIALNWVAAPGHENDLSKVIVSVLDITQNKQAEKALQDSETRYRGLFEDSPISLWEEDFSAVKQKLDSLREQGVTDFDAYLSSHPEIVSECIAMIKVLDVNKTTIDLYQAESKEALLTNLALLLRDPSHQQFKQELVDIAAGRTNFSWEGENWTLTGKRIDVAMNWSAAPRHESDLSKVIVSIVDTTQKKQAEQALHDSEERYRLLFLSNPLPSWVYDRESVTLLAVNDAAVANYGYTREEFLKLSIADIQLPEDLSHAQAIARDLPGQLRRIGIWKQRKKDGSIIDVEITTHDLPFEGRDARIVVANDITERLRAERVRETIYKISQIANSTASLERLFKSIHELLGELIPVKNFFMALYDREIDQIEFPYCIDQYEREFPPRKFGRGLTEYVIRSARPLLADQVVFDQLLELGEVELIGIKPVEWLGVPLRAKDQIFGVIATQSYEKGIHFKQEDEDLLEFISTQVALEIERKRVEELLRSLSLTDDLTGLYNRRGFNLLAEQQMKQAHRVKSGMLLLYSDLDYLKDINDNLGHSTGDLALQEIALVLKETFREADIMARLGGDEFVVLAMQDPRTSTDTLTNRLQNTLKAHNNQKNRQYQLSLSIGIARYDLENPCSLTDLISRADQLMYKQKQTRHGNRSTPLEQPQ